MRTLSPNIHKPVFTFSVFSVILIVIISVYYLTDSLLYEYNEVLHYVLDLIK